MLNAAEIITQADADSDSHDHAVVMIENITADWAVELGAAWNIPVQFFVEYLSGLDKEASNLSLYHNRLPGDPGGLASLCNHPWAVVRGVVDYGQCPSNLSSEQLPHTGPRKSGESSAGRFLEHTNIAHLRVRENLGEMIGRLRNSENSR